MAVIDWRVKQNTTRESLVFAGFAAMTVSRFSRWFARSPCDGAQPRGATPHCSPSAEPPRARNTRAYFPRTPPGPSSRTREYSCPRPPWILSPVLLRSLLIHKVFLWSSLQMSPQILLLYRESELRTTTTKLCPPTFNVWPNFPIFCFCFKVLWSLQVQSSSQNFSSCTVAYLSLPQ